MLGLDFRLSRPNSIRLLASIIQSFCLIGAKSFIKKTHYPSAHEATYTMSSYLYRVEFETDSAYGRATPSTLWLHFPTAPQSPPPEERRLKEIQHGLVRGGEVKSTFPHPRYYTATSESLRWAFFRSLVMRKVIYVQATTF
jgi:hypothetical protein